VIGLDTNILVRYIAQDDAIQSPKATALIEQLSEDEPGFVALVSIVELVWVMQSCYAATRAETVAILDKLLKIRTLAVERADVVFNALRGYARSNADFADCLIERSAHHANCSHTMTFDEKAAKTARMRLLI
jgi:predicted nucleic-acid-binding protein